MAAIGNKNSSKENRVWGKVVKKLAVQEDFKRIHKVAEALFAKAEESQEITGDSDAPITVIVKTGIDE